MTVDDCFVDVGFNLICRWLSWWFCRWVREAGETGWGGRLASEEIGGGEELVCSGILAPQGSARWVHAAAEDVHGPTEGHGAGTDHQGRPG